MRMTTLATSTTRETPGDVELVSHGLLVRAGYIKQHSAGIYSLLPLGLRVVQKTCAIIRDEMDGIGGQEVLMPVVSSAELWQETGRYQTVTEELLRFKDRNDKDMVLNMTHEEVVTDIMRRFLKSYRQLPAMIYQIQTKYRDEARPRGGVIRMREFMMKDAYSFHTTPEDLDRYYDEVLEAYRRIYARCGLPIVVVQSDPGMMGGKVAHEFMAVTPGGEDTLILCDACGYAANREVAVAGQAASGAAPAALAEQALGGVAFGPALAEQLGQPLKQLVRAHAFRSEDGGLVIVFAQAHREINGIKLQNAIGAPLATAREAQLAEHGLSAAELSPLKAPSGANVRVLFDSALATTPNLTVPGAQAGSYATNANWERDFAGELADVTTVVDGEPCVKCGGPVHLARAIEVGNIFKLGTKYSAAMKCLFAGEGGEQQPAVMGCYGIGVQRIMASIIEKTADERGIILPIAIAPYHVHIVATDYQNKEETKEVSERLYRELRAAGVEVLFDERNVGAGIKFNDADLIGVPIQVVVGSRGLKNGQAEVKLRATQETELVALDGLVEHLVALKQRLEAELRAS